MTDYRVYKLSARELIEYYVMAILLCFTLGMLFYQNMIISAALCLISPFFQKEYAKHKQGKRKKEMIESFKDCLYSISASVAAGRQMPQAIEDAYHQASLLHSPLEHELEFMCRVYKEAHGKIDELLTDFGQRSDIAEIKLFASSYSICKKTGGDLEGVCLKSAYLLIDRIDYASEVSAVLSEKKLDTILLLIMPLAILFFLNLTSYDYISLLYESLEGRIIMTLSLFLMALAALWSLRLMKLDL